MTDEEKLLEIYKIAVEEYRFQVLLNWDRNKFYVLLNSTLIGVTAGILKLPSSRGVELFMIPLFIVGFIMALIGFVTLQKGHEYYRRTVFKKTQLETQLNLNNEDKSTSPEMQDSQSRIGYSINTTAGMREAKNISEPEKFVNRPFRIGSVTYYLAVLFVVLMLVNIIGILLVIIDRSGNLATM